MADFATTNITPAVPAVTSFVTVALWTQRPPMQWSPEMVTKPSPRTPLPPGSEPRSNVGLVFPRGG